MVLRLYKQLIRFTYMYNHSWTVNSNSLDLHLLALFAHVYLLLLLYFTCVFY